MTVIAPELIVDLKSKANTIRQEILKMIYAAGSGHPGGALSAADIVTVLYFHIMKIDPNNPEWEDRDRFILSKGHACPVLYAALAERGYFPRKELYTLRRLGSILQGHPDMKKTPGVDMTSGSLGHGLSAGLGMALGARLDRRDYRVYIMLGDGEVQEGLVWEAAMAAAHYQVDNLIAIVDYNHLQVDGYIEEIMGIEPLIAKWQAFGWQTREINGHNFEEIVEALKWAQKAEDIPRAIIAHTIKGRGVSFMENRVEWHGKAPTREELEKALHELEEEST